MTDNSDGEDDDFVSVGTPLEPLQDDVRKKPVHVSDMVVKDKEGRVRFHGAFTGGFSAGYFNSVGSKEGWTPSTFRSSRVDRNDDRNDASRQRAEDFMDNEDFGEFGIAPRRIKTSTEFGSTESTRKRPQPDQATLLADTLSNLIVPERTSIGIRLLRKLGWKEGQGIGPRVKKSTNNSKTRVYGCALPAGDDNDSYNSESDDDFLQDVTFAPKDVCPISFRAKDDTHGIGYSGINLSTAMPSVTTHNRGVVKGRGRGIHGQAFGVGALEEDDDDIYGLDQLSNYDMSMDIDDNKLYGWTAPKSHRHQDQHQAGANFIGAALQGFHIATQPCTLIKTFPPPKLPKDFRAMHVFKGETQSQTKTRLDPITRGLMIGESPHLNSVFELVSPADRNRITHASQPAPIPQTKTLDTPSPSTSSQTITSNWQHSFAQKDAAPSLDQKSYMKPFAKTPAKQIRYEKYSLLVSQGHKDAYQEVASSHMTEWEREQEQSEFERSIKLYRPLSAMMSSRFTAGRFEDDPTSMEIADDRNKDHQNDLDKAVEMRMFGRLTRETHEWHPHKLLCKRFNVPCPYPGSTMVGLTNVRRDKVSVFNFLNFSEQMTSKAPQEKPKAIEAPPRKAETLAKPNIFVSYFEAQDAKKRKQLETTNVDGTQNDGIKTTDKDVDTTGDNATTGGQLVDEASDEKSDVMMESAQTQESNEGSRPSMDLFKAIFANSDTSSDEDDMTSTQTENVSQETTPVGSTAQLTMKTIVISDDDVSKQASEKQSENPPINKTLIDIFGPRLPPAVPLDRDVEKLSTSCHVPLDETDKKPESHRKHKRRKTEKHKHKKEKKSKHKKDRQQQKKKRHKKQTTSSTSGSEADSDDSDHDLDSKLLHRLKSAKKNNLSLDDL